MRRSIYKKIQYLTFDFDLGVKVTQNIAQYPLCDIFSYKVEVATSNQLGGDTLTRNIIWSSTLTLGKVTRTVAHYPLHHVAFSTTKFEATTSNGLGGDTFNRNETDGRTDGQTG